MISSFFKTRYFILVSALVLLIVGELMNHQSLYRESREYKVRGFIELLHEKEQQLAEEKGKLIGRLRDYNADAIFASYDTYYKNLFLDEGIGFLVYRDDKLIFWSGNHLKTQTDYSEVSGQGVEQLGNGWYEVSKSERGRFKVLGFILIRKQYAYQNQYLSNNFQRDFKLKGEHFKLSLAKKSGAYPVHSASGSLLFYLEPTDKPEAGGVMLYLLVAVSTLGVLFLFLYLHKEYKSVEKKADPILSGLLYIVFILGLRYVMISLKLPGVLYELDLFGPGHFASSEVFPSLGDFLINALLFFYLSYFFYSRFNLKRLSEKLNKYIIAVGLMTILFVISLLISAWLTGLIENSNISFNVNDLFSLSEYSFTGFLIIALLLFSYFLMADRVVTVVRLSSFSLLQSALVYFVVALILFWPLGQLFNLQDAVYWFWSLPITFIVLWVKSRKGKVYNFSGIILLLLFFSGYSAYLIEKQSSIKEDKKLKILAKKLSEEKDPVAEFLFIETEQEIKKDPFLIDSLGDYWNRKENIDEYIIDKYFRGYWEKYDINITACREYDSLLISHDNKLVHCEQYFSDQIGEASSTEASSLYYLGGKADNPGYIAVVEIMDRYTDEKGAVTLYIEFYSKYYPQGEGYPELLLDKEEMGQTVDLENYSYAKYNKGKLISSTGKYNYPIAENAFAYEEEGYTSMVRERYYHMQYRSPTGVLIVISRPGEDLLDRITTFSYLFTFFSLLLIFPVLMFRKMPFRYNFALSDFNTKIQLFMVSSILVAIVLFGLGTTYYIKKQYYQKNLGNISEKMRSILIEVEHKLGREEKLGEDMKEYMTYILVKFSNVFYTDINLYDVNGELLASSRPEVFNTGLMGDRMDITAYKNMAIYQKTEFIHREKIGNLEYLSAYVPFRNEDDKLLAYLNLPYFAKQDQLEQEISEFLVALINIYVLLFALSIMVAVVFANYISRPLRLIRSKIGKLRLGKSNELIEWKGNDEIGSLVKEYNRMVEELARSAELLAKTERESAWREMARQVAHEIKNPLTPMKLSIQHLQRSAGETDPEMGKRIGKTAQTLIEQIDTLSAIASEFSNFAKMPKAKKEKVDLPEVIKNTVGLYGEKEEKLSIRFENRAETRYVMADKDQLVRVFNNLVKNAIQAIPDERKGKIEISLEEDGNMFLIIVSDNGKGIEEDQLDKIFAPNFTTKTGGMGLGLAMVKSIVEMSGGEIWFETKEGKGTSFYVHLPVLR